MLTEKDFQPVAKRCIDGIENATKAVKLATVAYQTFSASRKALAIAFPRKWIFRPKLRRPRSKSKRGAAIAEAAIVNALGVAQAMAIIATPTPKYKSGMAQVK